MQIRAFAALRPTTEHVAAVASVPYDTINTDEARALAAGHPHSFLHVIRPEIDLPPGTDMHADAVYAKAAENLADLQRDGILQREKSPAIYVYRQIMHGHAQTGVVACAHVDEYEKGTILKHEKTRQDKEDDRTRHVLELNAHAGPVFLTYRDQAAIDQLVAQSQEEPPLYDLTAEDGVRHTVWLAADNAAIAASFKSVPVAYIADGHHRSAAACRAARQKAADNPAHTGNEEYNWFLSVLFPSSQLKVLPYNRVVHDLNGLDPDRFLAAVAAQVTITADAAPAPATSCGASMYLAGRWYGLTWELDAITDPVSKLDVSVLQDRILAPILGIDDPRTATRIDFIGGIRGTDELEKRVDNRQGAVAFSMHPVTIEQMMAIADADQIMPPKSTWFEPKLRSGLLVHTLD
jgi:uncharacterized protein (DUF1015 family)